MTELEQKIINAAFSNNNDRRRHISLGFAVYESFEDYSVLCLMMDEDDVRESFDKLDRVVVDGKTFYVDFFN